jgi:hypothetical protein
VQIFEVFQELIRVANAAYNRFQANEVIWISRLPGLIMGKRSQLMEA